MNRKIFSFFVCALSLVLLASCAGVYSYSTDQKDLYGKWQSEDIASITVSGTSCEGYFIIIASNSGFTVQAWQKNDDYTADTLLLTQDFSAYYEASEGCLLANVQDSGKSFVVSYDNGHGNKGTITVSQTYSQKFEVDTERDTLIWQGFIFSEYEEKVLLEKEDTSGES